MVRPSLIFLLLFIMTGFVVSGQQKGEMAGAWSGWVKTSDKKITYEVVISDSAGFYSGYSKIIFKVKGEEFSAIKSLTIKQDENDVEKYYLEEEKLISDNFEEDAPKKIKQINTVFFTRQNKKLVLEGTFKTKATMGIRSATGDVYLEKNITPDSSLLFSELGKMDKTKDLSFVKNPPPTPKPVVIDTPMVVVSKPVDTIPMVVVKAAPPVVKPPAPVAAKPSPPKPAPTITRPNPVVSAPVKPSPTVVTTPVATTAKPITASPVKRPTPVVAAGSASDLNKRNIETIQTIYFSSDSLKLTLYDNGEVDGDTVSVVINGKVFMGKKGLSTNAITETFYITEETGDSIQMIMYAENLGNIAPNTGLLIVQDGKDRYEVRFSGDLTKNAAIIFKRKGA